MRLLFVLGPAAALVSLFPAAAGAGELPKATDLKDNVEARLVSARNSQKRTHHLVAKFETTDSDRREIVVEFPSGDYTTHDRTLIAVLCHCMGWEQSVAHDSWADAKVKAVFSVPRDGKSLERCFLISLSERPAK